MRATTFTWVLVAALFAPAVARAQFGAKRAIVLRFGGPDGDRARTAIVHALEGAADLIPEREFGAAADRLGVRPRGLDNLARIASALRIDAIVEGDVERGGDGFQIVVRIRNGADAEILGSETFPTQSMSDLGQVEIDAADRLVPYLMTAAAGSGGSDAPPPGDDEPPPDMRPPRRGGEGSADRGEEPPPVEAFPPSDEAPPEGEEMPPDLFPGAPPPEPPGGRGVPGWLDVALEFGVLHRSFELAVEREDKPRTYSSGGAPPEFGLHFEFYPLAISGGGPESGLGLAAAFRHDIGLTTRGEDTDGQTFEIDTSQSEWLAGVLFNLRTGRSRKSTTLRAGVSYGAFAFTLGNTSKLATESVIESMEYTYIEFAAGARIAAGTDLGLVVAIDAAYRSVMDIGDESKRLFGEDTKGNFGLRLGAGLGLDLAFIGPGAYALARIDYFTFSTTFDGDPAKDEMGNDIQGSGNGNDATDRYFRAGLSLGYRVE